MSADLHEGLLAAGPAAIDGGPGDQSQDEAERFGSARHETDSERARAELTSHLAEDASADTRVATALLLAPDCSARKSLLLRAEREGGKRTRGLLERYSRGVSCTSSSDGACNACLAGSSELSGALAKLSEGAKP